MTANIILVHIGHLFPDYINDCVKQLKIFNENVSIYLILDEEHFDKIHDKNIILISSKELYDEKIQKFIDENKNLMRTFRQGFWLYTTLRFMYLSKLIIKKDLENVFHFENDVMVYYDLTENLDKFIDNCGDMSCTFEHDDRCVPSFIFIKNKYIMDKLTDFMLENNNYFDNDMILLSQFKKKYNTVKNLPIIFPEYAEKFEMKTVKNITTTDKLQYHHNFNIFNSIFDAAALGHYVDGNDWRNSKTQREGYINETSLFQCNNFTQIGWMKDDKKRKVPFVEFNNKKYKINNLHIHSKKLKKFFSVK